MIFFPVGVSMQNNSPLHPVPLKYNPAFFSNKKPFAPKHFKINYIRAAITKIINPK